MEDNRPTWEQFYGKMILVVAPTFKNAYSHDSAARESVAYTDALMKQLADKGIFKPKGHVDAGKHSLG